MLWDTVYAETNTKERKKIVCRCRPYASTPKTLGLGFTSLQTLDDYEIKERSEGKIVRRMIRKCS